MTSTDDPSRPLPPAAGPVLWRVFPNVRQSLLLLALILVTTLVAIAVLGLSGIQARVSTQLWMLLVILLGQGATVLAGLKFARWPVRRALGTLGFSSMVLRRLLAIGFGNLLVVGSLLFILTTVFGKPDDPFLVELFTLESPAEFLALFLTVALVAPLLEELLFRGVLLRGLIVSWGVVGGVLWSALFFALIHVHPLQAAPAFVNGLVWSLVLLRTGSLGATLFLHSLNNAMVFLLAQAGAVLPSLEVGLAGPSTVPLSLQLAAAALAALCGLWIVARAVRRLPHSPVKLATFWGLAPALAVQPRTEDGDRPGPDGREPTRVQESEATQEPRGGPASEVAAVEEVWRERPPDDEGRGGGGGFPVGIY